MLLDKFRHRFVKGVSGQVTTRQCLTPRKYVTVNGLLWKNNLQPLNLNTHHSGKGNINQRDEAEVSVGALLSTGPGSR